MSLFLHELTHLIISLCIGFLVWRKYKKLLPAFFAALLGGVLIDIDHLFDYFLVYGLNFNFFNFFNSYQFIVSRKVFVPFHAWEWVILLLFLFVHLENKYRKKRQYAVKLLLTFTLALTLGVYSHLIIDSLTNAVAPLGYSIIYRALNNFNSDRISNEKLSVH